jgi:hypothetical protein
MSDQHIHLHFHGAVEPDVVRAAIEAAQGGSGMSTGSVSEFISNGKPPDPEGFREMVKRAYLDSNYTAKPLLEFLADNPDRAIPYTEISQALGYPTNRSLPGLLGAFGRRAKHRYGGAKPFVEEHHNGSWHLRMGQDAADVINGLRSP